MINKILTLLLLTLSATAWGQEKSKAVIVTGRVLSAADSNSVNENFYNALREKTSGRIEQAAIRFQKVIEADPQNDAALYELGNLYNSQNKEAEAEDYARKAVTVNPDNKWYWLLLADIYKKKADAEQLILVFNELIRLDPDTENYYYDKANAYSLLNKTGEAEAVYQEIENHFGRSSDLDAARKRLSLKLEDPAAAITRLEKAIKKEPKEIDNYLSLSELYIKTGEAEKAQVLLGKAQKIEPENSFIHLLLSNTYVASGKTTEAFNELKQAFQDKRLPIDIKIQIILSYFKRFNEPEVLSQALTLASITARVHPLEPKAQAMEGDVFFQSGRLEEAKQSYKRALSLNKNIYLIWAQLLQLETAQNDYMNTINDGEEALSLFPHEPDLYFFTAVAYAQNNNHEKAVSYLKNAVSLNPGNQIFTAQIYSSLANSLNSLKKFKESDEAFEKALQLDPSNAYTLNNYAYYLSLRGERLSRAAEMSRRSNELQPGNASFEDTYAWVLFTQKKFAEARFWIEKAIKNNSNSGIQYEHYGDILFNLGEEDLALQQWLKAKDRGVKSVTLDKKINEKKFFE